MDPAAFAALVERCAPASELMQPLTAIVRQASSFEPLLITIQGRKQIAVQASDRDAAIQLTTEAIASGQQVRTGLAQLDAEEMKQAGLTTATTFDACDHIAGLGRLFATRLKTASKMSKDLNQAISNVVLSFAVQPPNTKSQPRIKPAASSGSENPASDVTPKDATARLVTDYPRWDVYRSGQGKSAFIYER